MNLTKLLNQLMADGLVSAENIPAILASSAPQKADASRAWYVRFLMGFSAWLAAILFIIALGIFGLFDSETAALLIGFVMTSLALALRIRSQDGQIFRTQLTLAASMTGQLLTIIAATIIANETAGGLLALVLALLLFVLYPDRLHRFLSSLLFVIALVWLCVTYEFEAGLHLTAGLLLAASVWLWWRADRRWSPLPATHALPASYALPSALFLLLLFIQFSADWVDASNLSILSAVFAILGALFVGWQILASYGLLGIDNDALLPAVTFLFILVLGLITASQPGLLVAFTVLALAFWRGDRVLQVLSCAFALFFISNYYYRLDITLLNKSLVLLATGAILLGAWALVRRRQHEPPLAEEVA